MRKRMGEVVADNWRDKTEEWGAFRLKDYIDWVRDTYGAEEASKLFTYVDSYRAVMDVKHSVEEPQVSKFPPIVEKAINDIFEQEYAKRSKEIEHEYNLTGL